jgi:hypothetical protein
VGVDSLTGLAAAGGSVYVGGPTILRVDVETGRVLAWRDVEPEYAYPRAQEGLLVFEAELPARVIGLDLDTLEPRLEVQSGDAGHPYRGLICAADADGDIRLFDPATGREAWHWQLPTTAGGNVGHFHHGDLYCRMSGVERIAIDLGGGAIRWRELEGDPKDVRASEGHTFYNLVGTTAYAGPGLSAYDVLTGALKWRAPLGEVRMVPRFGDAHAALGTDDGSVHVVDLATGRVVARHPLRRKVSDLALSGSRLFVKSFTADQDAHELHRLDLAGDDGAADRAHPPREPASPAPAPPKTPRTREQILADWPPKARDVLQATRAAHGDGYVGVVVNDPRLYVRQYAIREFGRIRDARAVSALLGLLSDEDYLTRHDAPIALARIGTEEARAGLFEAFRRAWTAQTRLDDTTTPVATSEQLDALSHDARGLREIAESMVILGPPAVEPLMAALRSGSEEVVGWSCLPLGALGVAEAVPLMLTRLTEDNNAMTGQVREAIRRIGPRAMPALVDARQNGSPVARLVVLDLIRALQGTSPPTAEGPPDPPGRA